MHHGRSLVDESMHVRMRLTRLVSQACILGMQTDCTKARKKRDHPAALLVFYRHRSG